MRYIESIPSKYVIGFKILFSIENEVFESIMEAISHTAYTSSLKNLSNKVITTTGKSSKIITPILQSSGSLARFFERGMKTDQIVNEVCEVLSEDFIDAKEFFKKEELGSIFFDLTSEENKKKFIYRLTTLLNSQQLYIASKANNLISENANVFIQTRVITDIRPIFNKNIEDLTQAGVIIHNLHIHYQNDSEGSHRDIFFSLDSNDLQALKDALLRAEKKEKSLKPVFEKAGIINLND